MLMPLGLGLHKLKTEHPILKSFITLKDKSSFIVMLTYETTPKLPVVKYF